MDETRKIVTQSIAATVAVILILGGAYGGNYWYTHREAATPPPAAPAAPPDAAAVAPPPAKPASEFQFPIDDSAAEHALKLEDSDAPFIEALTHLKGWRSSALRLLIPTDIIRHIVATVDALPRDKLPLAVDPVQSIPGSFTVATGVKGSVISNANERRYAPFVDAVTALDTAQLVGAYRHFYPLFQQAYRELGYPKAYFNDRLVEVIDDLLAAPEPAASLEVVAPGAMFHYVDPDLEALPAGQKILVRVGRDHEKALKAKLRDLRAAITSG